MANSLLRCTFALVLLATIVVSVVSAEDEKRDGPPSQGQGSGAPSGRGGKGQKDRGADRGRKHTQEGECECHKGAGFAAEDGKPDREARQQDGRPDREGRREGKPNREDRHQAGKPDREGRREGKPNREDRHQAGKPNREDRHQGSKPDREEDGMAFNFTTREKFSGRNGSVQHQGDSAERGRNRPGSSGNGTKMQHRGDKQRCDCRQKGEKSMSESGAYKTKDSKTLSRGCRGQKSGADQRGKKNGRFLQGARGGDDCDDEGKRGFAISTVVGIASAGIAFLCVMTGLIFWCCFCGRRPAKTPATAGAVVVGVVCETKELNNV